MHFQNILNYIQSSKIKIAMNFAWKILLIVSSIILLSVYTTIFEIVKHNRSDTNLFSRLTTSGKIYLVLVVGLIALNILVEVYAEKENNNNKQTLKDIKLAVSKSGLYYDSISKSILNNNMIIQEGGVNIAGSTVSELHDVYVSPPQKQYVDRSTDEVIDYELLNKEQLSAVDALVDAQSTKINSNCVYIFALYLKQQQKIVNQLVNHLYKRGFNVLRTGIFNPVPSVSDLGIAVEEYEKCIAIYVGKL
jgi:hypothetical protein